MRQLRIKANAVNCVELSGGVLPSQPAARIIASCSSSDATLSLCSGAWGHFTPSSGLFSSKSNFLAYDNTQLIVDNSLITVDVAIVPPVGAGSFRRRSTYFWNRLGVRSSNAFWAIEVSANRLSRNVSHFAPFFFGVSFFAYCLITSANVTTLERCRGFNSICSANSFASLRVLNVFECLLPSTRHWTSYVP